MDRGSAAGERRAPVRWLALDAAHPWLASRTTQTQVGRPQVALQCLGQGQAKAVVGRRAVQAQGPVERGTGLGIIGWDLGVR